MHVMMLTIFCVLETRLELATEGTCWANVLDLENISTLAAAAVPMECTQAVPISALQDAGDFRELLGYWGPP